MPHSTIRTVVILTAMFLVAALGFGAILGFFAIGTSISKVKITSGTPACTGTEVRDRPPAMTLRPGMKCVVPVTVRNAGRLTVNLDQVFLPFMGQAGGPAVQVKSWEGGEPEGIDIDAVFDLDRRLEPGDSWETEVQYEFRPQGCTSRGTFSSNLLEVQASAWGRSIRVVGAGVYFDGTAESSC